MSAGSFGQSAQLIPIQGIREASKECRILKWFDTILLERPTKTRIGRVKNDENFFVRGKRLTPKVVMQLVEMFLPHPKKSKLKEYLIRGLASQTRENCYSFCSTCLRNFNSLRLVTPLRVLPEIICRNSTVVLISLLLNYVGLLLFISVFVIVFLLIYLFYFLFFFSSTLSSLSLEKLLFSQRLITPSRSIFSPFSFTQDRYTASVRVFRSPIIIPNEKQGNIEWVRAYVYQFIYFVKIVFIRCNTSYLY